MARVGEGMLCHRRAGIGVVVVVREHAASLASLVEGEGEERRKRRCWHWCVAGVILIRVRGRGHCVGAVALSWAE